MQTGKRYTIYVPLIENNYAGKHDLHRKKRDRGRAKIFCENLMLINNQQIR